MKKLCAILMFIALLSLTACGQTEPVAGEELILRARAEYAALNSAHVEVVNNETGEAEQTFIFKYDEKGMMTYSYVGVGEGVYLAQYNNGREQFTNDNGEITALDSSNLSFTAYSREIPYPMAGEGLILFYKKAVIDGTVKEENGVTTVTHYYDPEKIAYDGEGFIRGFDVSYRFDSEGNLIDMCEHTDIFVGGTTVPHIYTIYISERNEVARVENVVDISGIFD